MPVLASWIPVDAALNVLIPLGLVSTPTGGLVIDLDRAGPAVGPGPTLAQLVNDGPTAEQLRFTSGRRGYLSNGGVDVAAASNVIEAFVERWPRVVLKCPAAGPRPEGAVAFLPLLPSPFTPTSPDPCVYQRSALSPSGRADSVVLPIPRRGTVSALMKGAQPSGRDRWLSALGRMWLRE
ncbi:MAG: hypothetical protein ACR2N2_04270 [Acidimicrobiia bacterium]